VWLCRENGKSPRRGKDLTRNEAFDIAAAREMLAYRTQHNHAHPQILVPRPSN
jgi:hypothetical protein